KTKFAMEQFDERFLKTVYLPNEICEEDLLAIARIHFPKLAEEYLRFVVKKALATERNFVSDIKRIAALAKDEAREQGRKPPLLADIKAAIADVLPIGQISPTPASDNDRLPIAKRERRSERLSQPIPGHSSNGEHLDHNSTLPNFPVKTRLSEFHT